MNSNNMELLSLSPTDRELVRKILVEHWGSAEIIASGRSIDALSLPGFKAFLNNDIAGLLTYQIMENGLEIVTLNSFISGVGIGRCLVQRIIELCREKGLGQVSLVTTNDNLSALRFYQKLGFVFSAVNLDCVKYSRRLKPEIPLLGCDEIPIRDEIELAYFLNHHV